MQSDWEIVLSPRVLYTQHFSTWECARVCTSTGISTNESVLSKPSVPSSARGVRRRGRERPSPFGRGELAAGLALGSHQSHQGHKPASTSPSHPATQGTAAPASRGWGATGTSLPMLSTRLGLSRDGGVGCCPTLLMPSHPKSQQAGLCPHGGEASSINSLWTRPGSLFGCSSTGASPGHPVSRHVGCPRAQQGQEKASPRPVWSQ